MAALLAGMPHATHAQRGLPDWAPVSSLDAQQEMARKNIWRSPSMQSIQAGAAFSNVSAMYQNIRYEGVGEVQRGTGDCSVSLCAQGLSHPRKGTTLYGKACYEAGRLLDVAWRETSDYDRLRPYGLADDFTGSLTKRGYGFSGGWARENGNATIGLSASYEARAEYRQSDPRPLNICSKGEIEASAALYSKPLKTMFCVDAGMELYHQSNNVLFANRKTGLFEYNMLGMGEYSQRFSGNKTDAAFRGTAWLIGVETLTRNNLRTSTFVMAGNTQWILMNINSLPLARLRTLSVSHRAIYQTHRGTTLCLGGKAQTRQGVEGIFGAGVDVAYPKLGEERRYHETAYHAQISIMRQWRRGKYTLACMPAIAAKGKKESYAIKEKKLIVHNMYPSWTIRLEKRWELWRMALETTAGARLNVGKVLAGTGDEDTPIAKMVYCNAMRQTRSFPFADMRILGNGIMGNVKYFWNLQGGVYKIKGTRARLSYALSCGIDF